MLFFLIFLCKYVLSSSVYRYGYIRRIDIDHLKVYLLFISLPSHASIAIFIYILNIRVLANCTSYLDNFNPVSA